MANFISNWFDGMLDKAAAKVAAVVPTAIVPFQDRGGKDSKLTGAKVTDLLFAELVAKPEMYLVDREELSKTLAERAARDWMAAEGGDMAFRPDVVVKDGDMLMVGDTQLWLYVIGGATPGSMVAEIHAIVAGRPTPKCGHPKGKTFRNLGDLS